MSTFHERCCPFILDKRPGKLALWIVLMGVAAAFSRCDTSDAAERELDGDARPFGVRVVDEATGNGVPLIELRTTNELVYITDNAGWAAVTEPDLVGREVYFHVSGPGYDYPKDGFGYRGRRFEINAGGRATLKVRRKNVAQRMCRLTGQGLFRESELLGMAPPLKLPQRGIGVMGQDSVQAVTYRGRIFWLWGDTNLANYPLGNFHVTAATSPLPGSETFHPGDGVPLTYFLDEGETRHVRKMMPASQPGAVWLFGLANVTGPDGKETLAAHYSRQKQLGKVLEHGLARFDDEAGVFKPIKQLAGDESWRFPRGSSVRVREDDVTYLYFTQSFANVRVQATWNSIIDSSAYEALRWDDERKNYRWQRDQPPTSQQDEQRLIAAGKLPAEKARYQLSDAASDKPVTIHRSSIVWNEFRKRWVMIGNQQGDRDAPSYLGELWYAEAEHITGPWRKAVKIATHPRYSFYNPRQHPFFAEPGGRVIYFEGTYTRMFSASSQPTPRYDYNQLLYRLDVADERLSAAQQ